jgi:hypothetical protein
MPESFWPEYLAPAARRNGWHLRSYGADAIVFGVDYAHEVVAVLTGSTLGRDPDTHVPETKPEVMWEGGDWLTWRGI